MDYLSRRYIRSIYGHSCTVQEIQKKFPYSNIVFDKKKLPNNTIQTTNPLVAMQYRIDKKPILIWGAKTVSGKHIFVFRNKDKKLSPIEAW